MTFTWTAQYNDGTTLNQIDPDGSKNAYEDINRDNLRYFSLYAEGASEPLLRMVFDNDDGGDLIWTRRVYNIIGGGSNTLHIVGKRNAYVMVVNEDGRVMIRDNFIEDGIFDEVIQ